MKKKKQNIDLTLGSRKHARNNLLQHAQMQKYSQNLNIVY